MSTSAANHFVFVDFENVPDIDLGLIAGHPCRVTLLVGKNQRKLDFNLVQQIHRLANQVELIAVGASSRNALDLTLAYYLGRKVPSDPAAGFHIVSGDKDFDPLIAHLKAGGITVTRHGSFASLPFLPRPKRSPGPSPVKPAPEDRHARVIARLGNPASRNRPASKQALLAHIKTAMGKEATEEIVAVILQELCQAKILTIDSKHKVHYTATGVPPRLGKPA